ncbi:hypothetical protein [Flammeovirga kamogawensis]|uniref:Lipoprotein n=1 Tax=Flammeovirga kamogawensis TaxID=373891 RepID=A0ABX8GYM4_9BACT|nr:hypothetical protein [Flammeovirga kamogawensis]MBB6458866.1 hypothetical protein [Flammeovirga kamogawensis]QWG08447.1 hypothetical protein KM029_05790 [Flammeovirga kamogawensis]TRX66744.1 hypothetical protein EO216_00850 [Flammeovirga kamogawensis]
MNKLIILLTSLSLISCLNQKNEVVEESLQFYSSDGNFLGRHIEEWENNRLISGVMNENSSAASIHFLEPRTWINGNGFFSILNEQGEQISSYIDERQGLVYSHAIPDQSNVFGVGTFENKFLFAMFKKEGDNWLIVKEKTWLAAEYTSGVIDLIEKTGDNYFVQGRVELTSGKSKIYFASLNSNGDILWERIHERQSSYVLPKSIDYRDNKVKIFIWEYANNEARVEIAEYTINPTTGLIENISYGSNDQHYIIDAISTTYGLVMIERNVESKDKLFLLKENNQWIELKFETTKDKLRDIIGKEDYFIVSSIDDSSDELTFHAININANGEILSERMFNNTTSSYILDVAFIKNEELYFTMTSSLLKFKYVIEFRTQ